MGDTSENRGSSVGEAQRVEIRDITPQINAMVGVFRSHGLDLWDTRQIATEIHAALYDAGYEITRRIQEPICGCGHPPRHHDKQTGRCYGRGCACASYTKS